MKIQILSFVAFLAQVSNFAGAFTAAFVPSISKAPRDVAARMVSTGNKHSATIQAQIPLDEFDPEIAQWIKAEDQRQRNGLELIASENFASQAVRAVLGSCLTNKYSEGGGKLVFLMRCKKIREELSTI